MKKVLLSILFLASFMTLIGCANSKHTILKTKLELVMLFDTLYQYAGNDSVSTSTVWLQRYREKLCTYYDKHHLGSDTISFYAKADTVINAIERLYDLNDDWNTMGMVVNNSAMFTLYKYR